ncbi:MAG: CPBP family intramembrane metalloprotease [Verrucomicrobia bacterium]|nr:CPBP family intramembrane metalloprotease [Verrucomicrobiota bacterium]
MKTSDHTHPSVWLLAVVPALVTPFLGALLYFVWFANSSWVQPVYAGVKLFTVLWPLIAVCWILREDLKGFRGLLVFRKRILAEGTGWGLAMSGAIVAVLISPLGEAVRDQAGVVRDKAEQMGVLSHFILFGLFISLLHSFLEEYYWRWFVFGHLHRFLKSKVLAHVVGALAFASHHIVVTTQFFEGAMGWVFGIAVGVGGGIWSWLMIRHRSLIGAWISHIIVDLTLMSIGYWLIFHVALAK